MENDATVEVSFINGESTANKIPFSSQTRKRHRSIKLTVVRSSLN